MDWTGTMDWTETMDWTGTVDWTGPMDWTGGLKFNQSKFTGNAMTLPEHINKCTCADAGAFSWSHGRAGRP